MRNQRTLAKYATLAVINLYCSKTWSYCERKLINPFRVKLNWSRIFSWISFRHSSELEGFYIFVQISSHPSSDVLAQACQLIEGCMKPVKRKISLAVAYSVLPLFLRQWDYGPAKPVWQLSSIHADFPSSLRYDPGDTGGCMCVGTPCL